MSSSSRRAFAALFPPLLTADSSSSSSSGDVDISVDDLVLPPLEKAVEAAIYCGLQRWNELEPVSVESALSYVERLKKYRAIVSWILYQNDDTYGGGDSEDDDETELPDDDQPDGDETHRDREIAQRRRMATQRAARRDKKRERSKRRKMLQRVQAVFSALPALAQLRGERVPSARLQAFVSMYTPKARALMQKRSLGATKTDLCFEFARPAPPLFSRKTRKTGAGENDEESASEEQGSDDETERPTHNVRLSNFLVSRGDGAAATPAAEEELVIWLDVLHPSKEPSKTQSFLVRESQTLADVVDLVACASDQRLGDQHRRSKLVFFDSQFYCDRRHADNIDYADQVRAWIRSAPSTRGTKYLCGAAEAMNSESLSLESTCFRDLALRVDLPGVYVHQGECEHLLRIRDARLPHEWDACSDGDGETAFPLRLPNAHFRALRSCFVCQQFSAKYISYGDRLGLADPTLFCERCYRAAHFDRRGELVFRDFQSFPYIQD